MKNYQIITAVFIAAFVSGPVFSQDKEIFQSDNLIKKWETPQVLQTPESVCFDPSTSNLFVSNINGKPIEKDGNGFISLLTIDGKITELNWVEGLNAPKGMGIFNGILYVTDIDRVAAIDINGAVYISDMMSTRIYSIIEDKTETWLDDKLLTSPNGLFVENDVLMIGCSKIMMANIKNRKLLTWLEATGDIDGIEGIGDGRYLFSDWSGSVYLVGTDKKIEKILDTTPAGINAADILYIQALHLLLVPTFGDNRVFAYQLK
jgi:hypothetical protein